MQTLYHCHTIYTSYQIFLMKNGEMESDINRFFSENSFTLIVDKLENQNDSREEFCDNQERDLKKSLKNFVDNCKLIIEGKDTLSFVLNMNSEESLYSFFINCFKISYFLSFL